MEMAGSEPMRRSTSAMSVESNSDSNSIATQPLPRSSTDLTEVPSFLEISLAVSSASNWIAIFEVGASLAISSLSTGGE